MSSGKTTIQDLPLPVLSAKADWLPGTTWLGFTPTGTGPGAHGKCQATVNRQMHGGLVLERVTQSFETPRLGYENDPQVVEDRKRHAELADRLIAVHQLRPFARPLADIIGSVEFEHLQDVWAEPAKRNRWSVAFPIVRSWEIVGQPKAHDVLSVEVFKATFHLPNALLRNVSDEMRAEIANLEVIEQPALNAWMAIEDEISIAFRDQIPKRLERDIDIDLQGALEGQTDERKVKIKKRAAWLAQRFWFKRAKAKAIWCDDCGFDPAKRSSTSGLRARTLFDVHHKDPLAEGVRRTTTDDFALLCPTCHRIEHARLRMANKHSR